MQKADLCLGLIHLEGPWKPIHTQSPSMQKAPMEPLAEWALSRNGPSAWMGSHGSSGWMGPGQGWALGMDGPREWMRLHTLGIDGPCAGMGPWNGWFPMRPSDGWALGRDGRSV